jgi:hypothetical protein
MLTIWGRERVKLCNGWSRRDFLKVGALGMGGMGLPDLLRLQAQSEPAARRAHKAVIMVYLYGGMPHLDMYDMKPQAPAEIRGELKPIPTRVPGISISELLPKHAEIMDKLAIIRNWEGRGDHSPYELLTGELPDAQADKPAFGSLVSRLRGAFREGMPQYVATSGWRHPTGYLGKAHAPFAPNGDLMKDLSLHVPAEQLSDRKTLLQAFDTVQRNLDATGNMAAVDELTARAFDMVASSKVRDALDLSREPLPLRAAYGKDTRWLLARRLVEAGVSIVSLEGASDSYDTHERNFPRLRKLLPELDQSVYALVKDLHDRGLDQDVAVVVWSEFGRTPKINNLAGRDHFPTGSVLMAGGGLKMGQVVGATDAWAERSTSIPYKPANVLATLYGVLGIDPATTLPDLTGRPVHLLNDRRQIVELQ